MFRARLQVPHGGAAKIPARFGASIQVKNSACPALVVKSANMIGAIELNFLWSTPKAECTPLDFKAAVSLPEPANNSMTTGPSRKTFLFLFLVLLATSLERLVPVQNSSVEVLGKVDFGELAQPSLENCSDGMLHGSSS